MRAKYGKHTLYLGSSHLAQSSAQHGADRGDEPLRKRVLRKGETTRRRLGIPMFMGCSSIPVFEHFEGVIGLVVRKGISTGCTLRSIPGCFGSIPRFRIPGARSAEEWE